MPTFKHSGDMGDIVYALPTVKALGGGTLYLDTDGGRTEPFVIQTTPRQRLKFGTRGYDSLRSLLLEQPYVTDVQPWQGQPVDYNLDRFRRHLRDQRLNLAAAHLREFGLPEALMNDPWLSVSQPPLKLAKPVVLNRSLRYHSKYHWWVHNVDKIVPSAVFIGFEKEHEVFQLTFDCKVDFHWANDCLEIARVLLGAQTLIGNQSLTMAIAQGLGTPYVLETFDYAPTSVFQRANAQHF